MQHISMRLCVHYTWIDKGNEWCNQNEREMIEMSWLCPNCSAAFATRWRQCKVFFCVSNVSAASGWLIDWSHSSIVLPNKVVAN